MPQFKIAFIGRSNVGKSSLINYILGQNVAKTSKHPGKTRKHDLFKLNGKFDLVDMPGYGYAAVDGKKREIWDKIMLELFFEDSLFTHLFVLIDSSIPPVKIDKEFLVWLVENKVPFSVIFTKTDKAKAKEFAANIAEWGKFINLLPNVYGAPKILQASALMKKGASAIKEYIASIDVSNMKKPTTEIG